MKRILILLALVLGISAQAQERVTKANYEQAARFSIKHARAMVHSTSIRPNWFRDSDRFWYRWETAQGAKYYIVDPAKRSKTEVFDMDDLAMRITEVTRDPYDARHIPLQLELKDDKYFQFDIESKTHKRDTAGFETKEFVTYRFRYDIGTKELTWDTEEHKDPYPDWANVSPDGTIGIYVKNHDLYLMDSTSLRLAAADPKDTLIVEKRLTFDGTADFSYNGDNYMGDTETDTTARKFPMVYWAPDGRRLAFIRWDMSMVKPFWVINSLSNPRPTLETYHYQMPGEPGPKGKLCIMDLEGSIAEVAFDAFKDQDAEILMAEFTVADRYKDYTSMRWMGDENGFWLLRRSRDLKRLDLCRVDVGADSTRTVVSERMNTYVENRNPKFLPGGDFLWWSERNGWANLYLCGPDGKVKKNLTEGSFHVEDVLEVGRYGQLSSER